MILNIFNKHIYTSVGGGGGVLFIPKIHGVRLKDPNHNWEINL